MAREPGVRYLPEVSACRARHSLRINTQRADAIGGGHVWPESSVSTMRDMFDLQDAVTARIVTQLSVRLTATPAHRRATSIEARDLCVRGRALITFGGGKCLVS